MSKQDAATIRWPLRNYSPFWRARFGMARDEGNGYVAPKAFHGARHASRKIAIMLLNGAAA